MVVRSQPERKKRSIMLVPIFDPTLQKDKEDRNHVLGSIFCKSNNHTNLCFVMTQLEVRKLLFLAIMRGYK